MKGFFVLCCFAISIAVTVFVVFVALSSYKDNTVCQQKGGTLVRTLEGTICAKLEIVK